MRDREPASNEGTSLEERRRDPFTRTLVLCETDNECPNKFYCHGGEGHKSCLQCRKSHRRCHRDQMCCRGNTCEDGRCIPHQFRFDEEYNRAVQNFESVDEEEESISQNTKDNFRKRHRGESCGSSEECDTGLCCAQHLWSRICKPMLEEGDVCTKKRDRLTDMFQRCECQDGLSCKRSPSTERRLHVCQAVKKRKGATSKEVADVEDVTDARVVDGSGPRERILIVNAEKTRPIPSKNGDFLEYLSAESGEKIHELVIRGDRWQGPLGRPSTKLKGTAYRDTTEISRTQQADFYASQLTVL
ncbi:dickkopf-related protein 2-like [Diadema antillarum]|uniref:dickkopf-related protein 2-like n=1 Tax=Diadema antillarum TaxID=105358 RepID=UPI003A8B62FB